MDVISNLEFSKRIKENPDGNYLFYGEEDYLKSHAVKSLKEAMGIDEALEIFNYVTLDVLDYTPDKLIDILSMPPMMAEKKLVVLSGLNIKKMTNKSDFNELLDALAHLDEFDYNVLVLYYHKTCRQANEKNILCNGTAYSHILGIQRQHGSLPRLPHTSEHI